MPANRRSRYQFRKPKGEPPRADEQCPLCKAPPNVPHTSFCPWRQWAEAVRHGVV